jgi:hypothetical protein
MSIGALFSDKKKLLDVGKEDLVPQIKAEINNGRWPGPPSLRLKLTFLKICKKMTSHIHLKLSEVASDPLVL